MNNRTTENTISDIVTINVDGREKKLSRDFAGILPPHSPEEHYGLALDIISHGKCNDPLKVWHNPETDCYVLLDGYLRLNICRENGIQLPESVCVDLPDHDAARSWVIAQQLNRRNLGSWWIAYFRGVQYNIDKLDAHRPTAKLPQSEGVSGETAEKIAKKARVSRSTIERNAKFARCIDQLESDLGEEFGKKILNREFRLSLEDINIFAEKPIEDKKAIADALSADPKLSLQEALDNIRPEESDPSSTLSNAKEDPAEPVNAPSDDIKKSISPQTILIEFKKSQEAYLERLYGIEEVEDSSVIPNMIKTEEAIISKLKELQTPLAGEV